MSGQTGRLSERQRVKPRLSLLLIRIRYFVVSLIPWSEARSHPPSQQNMFENRPCFRTFFKQKFVNFIAELLHLAYSPVIKILKLFVCQIYMVEETEELFYFFIHIKVQVIRIDQS